MKSRRILAAVIAPVCALSATAMVASAADESVELVKEPVDLVWGKAAAVYENATVQAAKAGDKVVIALSNPSENAVICVCKSDGWARLPGNETATGSFSTEKEDGSIEYNISITEDTTYTYTLTEEDAAILAKDGGLVIAGDGVTVDSVTYIIVEDDGDKDSESDEPADGSEDEGDDVVPGDSDKKPVVIEANIKGVDSTKGVEGTDLNDLLLVKENVRYTWDDVESVTFTSDKLFSVQFATTEAAAGTTWYTMTKEKPAVDAVDVLRADDDNIWATSWTIGAEEFAMFDTTKADKGYVKLIAKEDGTDISVTVNIKKNAAGKPVEGGNGDDTPPATGIALAIAPVVLAGAAAAVVAANKKRK